jgi:hypothetical protein
MTLEYRPTIVDVTEAAGVTSRTVSRVIQRQDAVSGATTGSTIRRSSASPSRRYPN